MQDKAKLKMGKMIDRKNIYFNDPDGRFSCLRLVYPPVSVLFRLRARPIKETCGSVASSEALWMLLLLRALTSPRQRNNLPFAFHPLEGKSKRKACYG
jgi:hypothetical protein